MTPHMNEVQRVKAGSIDLAYEACGRPGDPPVILVMGLGGQLHYWPDGFCAELTARGLYVVRFDNRDVGLSTHLPDAGAIDLRSLSPEATLPYTLEDLAADVVGLMRAIGLDAAHLVGGYKLAVELDVTLPQIADPERAAGIVATAHQVCPYSNATRGNIELKLTANGQVVG